MGFGVLLFTLYATQYSGNTLMGFTGAAYRTGFRFLVCTHFMTAIVACYLLFAPKLYRLNREYGFLTPGDFIYHRYRSHALRIIITILMVYALCNFTVAQLKTLGTAFTAISQGRVPMWVGVMGLLIIMLIYETLGGMRSVAWTDVIQGGILFAGFILLLILAWTQVGDLPSATVQLGADPNVHFKIEPPKPDEALHWMSFVLLVGLGGAIYPQAIQRVYAAASIRDLKRSLGVMAFLPLTTTLVAVSVGVIMAAHRPELDFSGPNAIVPSETVFSILCYEIMTGSEMGYWLVVILFAALIAAVMSTTDSALLSISSMITQDLYGQYIRPGADQTHLTKVGRWITWALMIPVTLVALWYQGNLIELLQLKFELLIQCVPAIYLGIHWKRLRSQTLLAGIFLGLATTLTFLFYSGDFLETLGVHPGIAGLAINLIVCGWDRIK